MESLNDKRATISYPRRWDFKIIGRDKDLLLGAIKDVMKKKSHTCKPGKSSSKGKFHSYNTSCKVKDQDERDKIFKAFKEHKDVDMVI